ncbi:cyclin-dependent kinase inhibitor 4-like isoform X1 [Silene latifolia]|uniref:cyclin-dependent kinase inhibitor 4-like isoform X1 n=1 Tax=Silene latifolia TaxID=37657 RepID=UPI003D772CE0
MGKYMKKSKSNNNPEIPLNLIDIPTPLGVRTRAKTLALQTQKSPSSNTVSSSSFGYLQLRNRRLLRLKPPRSRKSSICRTPNSIGNPNLRNSSNSPNSRVRVRVGVDSPNSDEKLASFSAQSVKDNVNRNHGDEFDIACFGENVLDSDYKERSTRESTPSNMIRDPDAINTPGSTTRPTCSAQAVRRSRNSTQRSIPTSHEMEEFFANAEEQQQKEFVQKYNFDPTNDKPLPGRYEWLKLKP